MFDLPSKKIYVRIKQESGTDFFLLFTGIDFIYYTRACRMSTFERSSIPYIYPKLSERSVFQDDLRIIKDCFAMETVFRRIILPHGSGRPEP